MANSIILKGNGVRQEAIGSSVIKPGNLIELNSSGNFVVHGTAGGIASRRFAVENDLCGKGVSDSYGNGEVVQANVFQAGDEIQAFLKAGESVVLGQLLESAGDGTLRAVTTGVALAIAREAKTASTDTLIKIEII